ncbi:MAG: catalase, partial [Pygmaiobacter massiliensis]|nr:catalase [Pygmaiobacter massiliensis]
ADAIRCRRSFTVKFFCREGEYDLFGMHLPVSVGNTEDTLTDCCAASRANPKTGLRTRAAFWEFLVTHPEALHATMWLYSDLGTIGSYRTIDGYGLPCLWVNAKNEHRAVRPRWLSRQRPQTLTRFEAEELAGSDPDAVARDLDSSLQMGERPQYELSIQVIEPDQFATLPFDPFDPTAIWPTDQFNLQRIGLLTLERPPDDAQTELNCARFQPENIIPGIEHVSAPAQKSGDDFAQVQQYFRSLGEFSRHRLIDNLTEELLRLPPLLLEQVLILFSRADLEFGQAVTLALGG